jgi:hypothetical protein
LVSFSCLFFLLLCFFFSGCSHLFYAEPFSWQCVPLSLTPPYVLFRSRRSIYVYLVSFAFISIYLFRSILSSIRDA